MINPDDKSNAFLGTGWSFPIRLTNEGRIATATAEDDIHQSIRIILDTNPGERLMRPDFGAGLIDFVFEPVNTSTLFRIKKRVQESLTIWEPRINVNDVQVSVQQENTLLVEIHCHVLATNSRHNFVYPFYLDEG